VRSACRNFRFDFSILKSTTAGDRRRRIDGQLGRVDEFCFKTRLAVRKLKLKNSSRVIRYLSGDSTLKAGLAGKYGQSGALRGF
jgi:hypothetical protein